MKQLAPNTMVQNRYLVVQSIGKGGMGEVYRGRNIHNGELVAIKIVLPSLAHDTKIVALFQKESTTLSRLSHEAIVRYHVFTNDPTIGRPCMVMEFVSGTALSDRIEQGPMPIDEVRVMLRRVASGLDKAHRAGVVHRDLSPDNVILEENSVEHAKLIDFGIAKSTNIGAGTLLQGQFAGKFNWVSPEQLGAFGGLVDGRSDIYSLALLTAAASKGEVLPMGASIVDAVGKRSSVPDLSGVDPELVPLLTWMLQPDPGKRIESMARVIAALDNPSIIPSTAAPEPLAIDPNRTVIGGTLPVFDQAPTSSQVFVPPTAPPSVAMPPMAAAPAPGGWDIAPAQPTPMVQSRDRVAPGAPPQGIATAPAPAPEVESEDVSPFGAPNATPGFDRTKAVEVAAVRKKGKGGLVTALVLLAAVGGGAAAYYGGVFDPKPPAAAQDTTVTPEDTAAAAVKAAEQAQAAEAAQAAADAQAIADAKAAADARAAAAAEAAAAADR